MSAFGRSGGAWVEGDLMGRSGGTWTDPNDGGFTRSGDAWVQFQPNPSDSELIPPQSLSSTPQEDTATATWTNPAQTLTPTHVQVRIPEITPVWTEMTYPVATAIWSALNPSTEYQFQVRYIVRSTVDGTVSNTSATTTTFFITLALSGPGTPAPDPGGTRFPFGPPAGGGGGSVGSSGCSWEYILQTFTEVGTGGSWGDSVVTGSVSGLITDLVLDLTTLGIPCGTVCRLKYREVCNLVPAAYEFGPIFVSTCGVGCGVDPSSGWSRSAFADALFAMPQICNRGDGSVIEDFITEEIYGKLAFFNAPGFSSGDWTVSAKLTASLSGSPIVAGSNTGLATIDETVDTTLMLAVRLQEQPTLGDAVVGTRLAMIGKKIQIRAIEEGAGFIARVTIPMTVGSPITLLSTTELPLSEWAFILITIDQDGDKKLYINGALEDTDTTATSAAFATFTDELELYGSANAALRRVAGWDRILTLSEILDVSRDFNAYTSYILSLGVDAHWELTELRTEPTVEHDDQVIAFANISVFFPLDAEIP